MAGFFSDSFLTFPPLPQLPALATPPPITLAASLGLWSTLLCEAQKQGLYFEEIGSPSEEKKKKFYCKAS